MSPSNEEEKMMNVTKEMIDAWVKDAPEWAVEVVERVDEDNSKICAIAYVGRGGRDYQYIKFSGEIYEHYIGNKFGYVFESSGFKYKVLAKIHKEPVVGEDVLVHFDGDSYDVWTKFKLEYQKGDVVVLYDYRIEDVESYSFSRITMKKYVKTVRENAIDQIASLIGRGTFAEDAEAIYDAIKSNEISIFTEGK